MGSGAGVVKVPWERFLKIAGCLKSPAPPLQPTATEGTEDCNTTGCVLQALTVPGHPGWCWWPCCPRGENWVMPSLSHPCQPGAPSILSAPQLPSTPARRTCLQGFIGNSVVTCRGFTVPGPAPPGPALGVFGLWQLSLVHSQQFVPGLAAAHPQCLCQPAAPPARHGASPAAWHLQRSQELV